MLHLRPQPKFHRDSVQIFHPAKKIRSPGKDSFDMVNKISPQETVLKHLRHDRLGEIFIKSTEVKTIL